MKKFRHPLYQKRIVIFFVFALVGFLVLLSMASKLGSNVQLNNGDYFIRFPKLLEKYGSESQEILDSLQRRAKSLQDWTQKLSSEAKTQHTKVNEDRIPRNDIQALLEDSTSSEVSSSTESYLKKQQDDASTSQIQSSEKQQTTSSERQKSTSASNDDKIALEVEKSEYWDQLYKSNVNQEPSEKQLLKELKESTLREDSQYSPNEISQSTTREPISVQHDQKLQVANDNQLEKDNLFAEKDSHLGILLEASKLQAKFGDCDNLPEQVADLPSDIKQTWCQMKGVDRTFVEWGIRKLEEMLAQAPQ